MKRNKWARMRRAWELGLVGLLLFMGVATFLALLPWLPDMVWGTVQGDGESARALFGYIGGVGICWLAWHWSEAVCPQLRKDAAARESSNRG